MAEESFAESERLLEAHRQPKEGGGYILTYDPQRRSLKNSLVSIAFAGAYVDLYLRLAHIVRRQKNPPYKWDRMKYEDKLKDFGVTDESILDHCKQFRVARNDVLHEKPLVIGHESGVIPGTAQDAAKLGVAFANRLREVLPLQLVP
jgi:hypothetical protein